MPQLPESSGIRAIIFDMDGVLIDARDWHYEALNKALRLFGYEISRYDHLVTYDGLPTKRKLDMLSMERGLPVGLHSFLNDLKQLYTMEMVHARCKPLFHHEYALSRLKADGLKLAVASNSMRATVVTMMEKANLSPYLDLLLSNQDVQYAKPHPEIYTTAINKLGLLPHQCLVVEDNANGIRAATDAGAHVMVVKDVWDVNLQAITHAVQAAEGRNRETLTPAREVA
jgi:beta-phosphoglucomutase